MISTLKNALLLRSPAARHLAGIAFSMGLSAVSNLAIMKIVAYRFGPDQFGEFMLIKRNTSWLQGPLLLGMGVSIPRFLAIAREKKDSRYAATLVTGMNILVLGMSLAPLLFAFASQGRETIASLLFGSKEYAPLVLPLITYNLALILGLSISTYLQGISSLTRYSAFNSVNIALVPLICVAAFKAADIRSLTLALSAACALLPLSFMSFWFFKNLGDIQWSRIFSITKTVLLYGFTRIPGDLAFGGLLAVPALTMTHLTSIRWAGATSFGLSLMQLGGTLFSPLGVLFLPKMSALAARNAKEEIRRLSRSSLLLSAVLGSLLTLAALAVVHWIIRYGLGEEFLFGKMAVASTLLAVLPYSLYVVLRSILDGLAVRAFNTENTFYALVSFCILGLGSPFVFGMTDPAAIAVTIGAAFSFSMAVLAGLSLWRLRQVIARI